MRKLLTLILAITMSLCLVNLNNNYTKAEGEENAVSELVAGPTFNATLVNAAGGADEIKSITFVGGKPQQQSEDGKLDVSSGAGKADVYATFDSSTGAITINCVNTTVIPKKGSAQDCYLMFDRFKNCKSISFGNVNFDTSSAITMEYMFSNCNSLEELDVSNLDTSKVTNMYGMFYGCKVMKKLILPENFGAASTSMHGLLCDCFELTDIVTPYQDQGVTKYKEAAIIVTDKCIDTHDMFSNCRSLSHIDLSKFDTSKVVDMGHMFSTCLYMTTLDLSGFDTTSVLKAEKMFQGCVSLFRIYVDKTKTYFNAIPETEYGGTSVDMFWNCLNLQGQNNTVYNDEKLNKEYARVDTAGSPGYFTSKDILYSKMIAYDRNTKYFRQYDADTKSFLGSKVENIEYNETTHVITINNLKIDSNINMTTLEVPDDATEINVNGNNYINNTSEKSNLIVSKKDSTGLGDFKFTGSGTLTLNNICNARGIMANNLEVNGPTIYIYGNTSADILPNIQVSGRLVMNNGKLIIRGGMPMLIYVQAGRTAPSITVNGGYIELIGITVPFIEYLEDGQSLVVPKAKITGSYSIIEALTSNVELRLYEENDVDTYAYYDVDADEFTSRLVFSPYTEKRYDCEESGGTVVCPVANTTSGSITDQTAHISAIQYDSLKDDSSYVTMAGNENISMTKDVDYVFSPGSVCVTLKKEFLSKLPVGTHTFNIHLEDSVEPANTVIDTTLTVKIAAAPTPSPSPSKKDESCEKVIGPTWHWNNKKGICEDGGSVKTYSR